MKLRLVPAHQGALWVRQGFAAFFKQPLAFSGMFAAFLFAIFLLSLLPLIGSLLLLALLPLGTLGFMIGTQAALKGGVPVPRAFIEPLRGPRARTAAMLQLGLIYATATFAIIWLSDLVDGGALDQLMETLSGGNATPATIGTQLGDPRLEAGLLLRFGLAALLSVPFWHAPALVHWDAQSVAQSLFSSTVACWRNKAAFAVFGLCWGAVILAFALVANLVAALLGQPQLVALAAMPASLLFSTVFYASLFFTFADCFELPGDPRPALSPPPAADEPPSETP
jgi:hypothetical protein